MDESGSGDDKEVVDGMINRYGSMNQTNRTQNRLRLCCIALLTALIAACITPSAVWAIAKVIPDTGRLYVDDTDLVVVAGPVQLEVRRTLLTLPDSHGLLGKHWRSNWDQDLLRIGDLALLTDNLGVTTFAPTKRNNIFQNDHGEQLRFDGSGAATLTRIDGTVERYDAEGRLLERVDRNNNRTLLHYNQLGTLKSILGPYKAELHFKTDEAGRVTGIETSTGDKVSYVYQGNLLSEVVVHNRRATQFIYDKQGALTRIEDSVSGRMEFRYDAKGRVTEQRTRDGLQTFEYDDSQRKVLQTNTTGGVTTSQWSKNRRRKEVVDPLGRKSISEYDERGHMVRATRPDGQTTQFGYDKLGRTTVIESLDGRALRFNYKGTGDRVASIQYPDGRIEQFEYDDAGNLKSSKGQQTGDVKFSYFSNGLPKEVKGPGSRVLRYTYTDAGQIASITDGLGHVVSYEYDANGRPIRETNPLGGETSRQYDDAGRLTQEISASGYKLRYQYDPKGRRTAVLGPEGEKTSYEYDSSGRLVEMKREPGGVQRYEASPSGDRVSVYQGETLLEERRYDKAGQLTQLTDAFGQVYRYAYDKAGRLSVEHLPSGSKLVHQYDKSGELVATEHNITGRTLYERDVAGRITKWTEPGGASWKYHYNELGRLIKQDDPNGHSLRFAYGAGGELKKVTTATGASAHYEYDSEGRLSAQRAPGAGAVKFRSDGMGNITWTADAAGNERRYAYNKAGDIIRATDALGRTITYEYNTQGRLSTERTGDGRAITYRYGPGGALTHIDDGVFPVTYRYDGNGWLESTRYPAIDQALHYAYDRQGRRTGLKAADGYRVLYDYGELGRVTTIQSAPSGQFKLSYDAAERLVGLSYPNGVTGKWSYDAAGLVRSLVYRDAAGKTLASWQYDYDKTGNPIEVARTHGDTSSYRYDPDGRLVEEKTSDQRISYRYAPSGDRIKRQDKSAAQNYRYDKAGRLLSAGQIAFDHDADGNLVTRTGPKGKTNYQVDHSGRLVSAQLPSGEAVSFRYAPSGERVARRDQTGTHYLLYDGLNLIQELTENGAVVASYTHGPGFDWPLAMMRKGQSYFYHADAFGNVAMLTDKRGKVVAQYTTDAFGNLVTQQGDIENPFIFSSREYDPVLGLYYFHSRYYDSALGRFLSPDPVPGLLSDPVSLNRYVYARNAPTRYRDPLGLYEIDYAWIQRNLGLNPGQVDDLVMQERMNIWKTRSVGSSSPPSPTQVLADARQSVESRLWYEGMRPDSERIPSKVMSRVRNDINASYPKPKMAWETGRPTQIDRYTGKTKFPGQTKAPSGRTTIAGRTRPGPAVRGLAGRTTVQVPQAGAQGVSPSRIAGGGLGILALGINIKACMDEGNSPERCAAELGVAVGAALAAAAYVTTVAAGTVLASPWVALAGAVSGIYIAGSRWSEAPAVEAENRRRREIAANIQRISDAVSSIRGDFHMLEGMSNTAQQGIDLYERSSNARRMRVTELESSAGALLRTLKTATRHAGREGDSDDLCIKAQLLRDSIEVAVPRMDTLGGLIEIALEAANTLADRCPSVNNPSNIRTLYEGAQQRTQEMGVELSQINADAETVENHLSVLRNTHIEAVATALNVYTAITEKKEAVEAVLRADQEAVSQARSTFASEENIGAFNELKRRALQKLQRLAYAFGHELEGDSHFVTIKNELEALVYPSDATSVVSMLSDPIRAKVRAVTGIANEADAVFAGLPENPFCTVESAADLVDRADTAYTRATEQLLANEGLPDRAETCLGQEEDTTAPGLYDVPSGITAEATSPSGAAVGYPLPTASDAVDPAPSVSCNPPSGSTFPLGGTSVSCVATDASGNRSDPSSFIVTVVDTTPPSLAPPAGITAEATSPAGAVVNYPLPTASDAVDPAPSVSCDPPAGGTFPLDGTSVSCVTSDASGNSSDPSILVVTVEDTTPPSLAPLAGISADATSDSGAVVGYPLPTASDAVDPEPRVSCNPPSGSTFPLGSTSVSCVATDASGNRSDPRSFRVTILSEAQQNGGGDGDCDPTDPLGDCYNPIADSGSMPGASGEQVRKAADTATEVQAASGAVGEVSGGMPGGVAPIAMDCEYTGTCPETVETTASAGEEEEASVVEPVTDDISKWIEEPLFPEGPSHPAQPKPETSAQPGQIAAAEPLSPPQPAPTTPAQQGQTTAVDPCKKLGPDCYTRPDGQGCHCPKKSEPATPGSGTTTGGTQATEPPVTSPPPSASSQQQPPVDSSAATCNWSAYKSAGIWGGVWDWKCRCTSGESPSVSKWSKLCGPFPKMKGQSEGITMGYVPGLDVDKCTWDKYNPGRCICWGYREAVVRGESWCRQQGLK